MSFAVRGGVKMKRRILIAFIVALIITQVINIYFIAKTYNKLSDNSSNLEEVQDAITIKNESPVMNIEQAADYVGVTAEQLKKMIQIEKNQLSQRGSFSGEMIPYFKVNDDLLFYRSQLDVWLQYVSIQKVEYNLVEGYRFE